MKVKVNEWSTDGFPTNDEIEEICKVGQGDDTCIWLVYGNNGFECTCWNKPYSLMKRWEAGQTIAKRDGCMVMNHLDTIGIGLGEHEINLT